ncbi:MAG: threonine dehydratase [Alphaproteobacteria bacterium]|nr:threonine dehydratase [Alphaproteobacteria bacterium]
MNLPNLAEIDAAAAIVYRHMQPTPQIAWPLLAERAGCEVWVKHENHTPIGAFKVRGGLVYLDDLKRREPELPGIIGATRGNHGQSLALAARAYGIPCTLVVPHGNSVEKNRAMRAFGAELIETGHDFQAAYEASQARAGERGLHLVASFHPLLIAGVATYARELLMAVADLDVVFVPIGLGSGICGMIAARDALGLKTEVIGVVAENAPAYLHSFREKRPVSTNSANTLADGMACRVPVAEAVAAINRGAADIIAVSEAEILAAMQCYFSDIHNIAEGAGAAPLAALLKTKERWKGRRVGVILSGGNLDRDLYIRSLSTS